MSLPSVSTFPWLTGRQRSVTATFRDKAGEIENVQLTSRLLVDLPFLEAVAGVILLASPSEGSRLAAPAPLVAAIENLTGGLQANVNAAHLLALMRNSTEQQKITADFNAYCTWYQTTTRRKLIVHALRETAPVAPGLPLVSWGLRNS